MKLSRDRFTLILLTEPGAPARQLQLPRAWPVFLGVFSVLSITGSMLVGREARAWFEPELERPAVSAPIEPDLEHEEPLQLLSSSVGSTAFLGTRHLMPTFSIFPRAPEPVQEEHEEPTPVSETFARTPGTMPLISGKPLVLWDVNRARSLRITPFNEAGLPDTEAFTKLRGFMSCRRSGHESDMDPRLIAVLSRISQYYGNAQVQIISAHRKPDGKVTSETSQHAYGTAADIRVAGVAVEELAKVARELGARGVGVYTKSRFVHVDVRTKRYSWRDDNGDELGATLAATVP